MMIIRNWITAALIFVFSMVVSGQGREKIFAHFVADSITVIDLNFKDSVVIDTWHNSAVFVETSIVMTGCPENTLKHLIKQGRYDAIAEKSETTMSIRAAKSPRDVLNTPRGTCIEEVVYKIYIPADFESTSNVKWVRREEKSRTTINE